jgi:hypothetical protein
MEEVAFNTIKRKITTAENPKRQSLIHPKMPKETAVATPTKMKKNHKAQQKRESAVVLLKS